MDYKVTQVLSDRPLTLLFPISLVTFIVQCEVFQECTYHVLTEMPNFFHVLPKAALAEVETCKGSKQGHA